MPASTITFEEYRKLEAFSRSDLEVLLTRSPAHLKAVLDGRVKRERTDALHLGALAHTAILEPYNFFGVMEQFYSVKPKGMKFTSKEGKEWKKAQVQAGRQIITQAEFEFLKAAPQAIKDHPEAYRLFETGYPERTFVGEDPVTGLKLKSRMDFVPVGNVLVDVKTAVDARPAQFLRAMLAHGYHRQAQFYLKTANLCGEQKTVFVFVVIEKRPPYAVAVYRVSTEMLLAAAQEIESGIRILARCVETGLWPAYEDAMQTLQLPEWYDRIRHDQCPSLGWHSNRRLLGGGDGAPVARLSTAHNPEAVETY
jgi:hypothetical protein